MRRLALRHPFLRAALLAGCALLTLGRSRRVVAAETVTSLKPISVSTTTGEKPQSKVWAHGGRWWTVLPSKAVKPTGTWVWRLEPDASWKAVLHLSSSTSAKADAVETGDVTHVLLHQSAAQLVSIEYRAATETYAPWSVRPTATALSLSGSETATLDVDTTQRLWVATESGSQVRVYHSAYPYTSFAGPVTLATNIHSDDIAMLVALPLPLPSRIGVFWSNQATRLFAFRTHVDGDAVSAWSADEQPASHSARRVGNGLADDHMNFARAADGTLYAAVKTSYHGKGEPEIALLVRRPNGTWDDVYQVDASGTRPCVVLNEALGFVRVFYSASTGGGSIYYRDSPLDPIGFGARKTALGGSLNNVTSTKQTWSDDLVVIASGRGALFRQTGVASTSTTSSSTTSTSLPAGPVESSTSTSSSSTTSSTVAGVPVPTASVTADVSTVAGSGTALGTASRLEIDGSPAKRTFLKVQVGGTNGHRVTSAVLRLTVAPDGNAHSDTAGRLHVAGCDWTETGLTGTTQPQPTVNADVLPGPSGAVVEGQAVEFDLTGTIMGDGTWCFALDSVSTNGTDYQSREASSGKPVVTIAVAP